MSAFHFIQKKYSTQKNYDYQYTLFEAQPVLGKILKKQYRNIGY